MSQEQLRRPQGGAIKYGDVFAVTGDLANEAIAPQDAAMMQSAETLVLGRTQRGGPAAVMQSAADRNEQAGLIGHTETSDKAGEEGVTVAGTDVGGAFRVVTESVAGQVVGQCTQVTAPATTPADATDPNTITIGEALEATAITVGDKPVEQSDTAAIQAAEVRATGSRVIQPGGVAATAQSAATVNLRTKQDANKTKLGEVLSDAAAKLPGDRAVTRQDAEGVMSAEVRNNPNLRTRPGGVAASVAAAASLNEVNTLQNRQS